MVIDGNKLIEVSVQLRKESRVVWKQAIPDADDICRDAAVAAWVASGHKEKVELNIVLGDDSLSRSLNLRYRGLDAPTNVLSFAMGLENIKNVPQLAGDVVIAIETLLLEAVDCGKSPSAHLGHLVVHGILHLAGFSHEEDASAENMERVETSVLASLGIQDPYRGGSDAIK